MYGNIYWKSAGRHYKTNEKSRMLIDFETKFDTRLMRIANTYRDNNLWTRYLAHSTLHNDTELENLLRNFDLNFNVTWSMKHYKLAAKHLRGSGTVDEESTGGTNWRKFLPPKNQKISFFPGLWSAEELSNWGHSNKLVKAALETEKREVL
jgi:tryptophan 2,3-dioxygenase